jgi:hypothetical protein
MRRRLPDAAWVWRRQYKALPAPTEPGTGL